MSQFQLSKVTKLIAALKPTTAVSSGTNSSGEIDTAGFGAARAILFVGLTSGDGLANLTISGATATGGNFATLSGTTSASVTTTTGMKDGLLAVDVKNLGPNRYIKANYTSASTLVQHGGIVVELYNPTNVPTTDGSTSMLIAQKVVVEAT
jgi:hypothetical protein